MCRRDVNPGDRVSGMGHPSGAPSADTAPAERVLRAQPPAEVTGQTDVVPGGGRESLFLLQELKSATPRRGCCHGRVGVRQSSRRPCTSELGRGVSRGQLRF